MAYLPKILVAAGIALAMAFTFSCSDDGGGDDTPSSSSGIDLSSSSSDTSYSSSGNDSSSSDGSQSSSSVDDGSNVVYGDPVIYGGETYQTVVIGTQTWFARNLNYDPGTGYSMCYEEPSNCVTYGRLYNWTTAMALEQDCLFAACSDDIHPNHQGICPEGWHISSLADWNILIEYAGGSLEAGAKLKAANGWYGDRNGTDDYGFSALPGGGLVGDYISGLGNYSWWWLPSEYDGDGEYWTIRHDGEVHADIHYKTNYYSVRCVKNLFVIDW